MKHQLKMFLRTAYARVLYHTGLHAVVDRLMPRRWTILAGHCVDASEHNELLPRDMKIAPDKLEDMIRWFQRRYLICTVGEGMQKLSDGGSTSLVTLSMDDGYRDNAAVLLPMLRRIGVPATIFLESRPLDERKLNWTHKYFWILSRMQPAALCEAYVERSQDEQAKARLQAAAVSDDRLVYRLKRIMKYDAQPADRDRVLDALFEQQGGDETALCERLYMTWDDARRLHAGGVELGGHTVGHQILSTLDEDHARSETTGCHASILRELGVPPRTFAYPFGRRWDYDEGSKAAVSDAGFEAAVTTHAGTNASDSDPMTLKRLMIDEDTQLHFLVTEACGGFDLLRRFGVDLSE